MRDKVGSFGETKKYGGERDKVAIEWQKKNNDIEVDHDEEETRKNTDPLTREMIH